jgi:urease accessory protein
MIWRILQIADSAFPTGGFAHSFGLEAALQAGEAKDLRQFGRDALWQAGYGALPFVRAAHGEVASLPVLDARADAFLANHVANRASRTQGRALLATCERIFPQEVAEAARAAGGLRLHVAPLWGAVCAGLSVGLPDAQRLFLWNVARGVLSAAVRLGAVGTHEAQAMLAGLAPVLDRVLADCGDLGLGALAQTAALADLLQGAHDRLYSRLFQS